MAAATATVLAHDKELLSMTPPLSAELTNDPATDKPSAVMPNGAGDKPNGETTAAVSPTRKYLNANEVGRMTVSELEQRMEVLRQLYQRHLKELGRFTPEPEEIDANAAKPVRAAAEASKQAAANTARAKLEEVAPASEPIPVVKVKVEKVAKRSDSPIQRRSARAPKPPSKFVEADEVDAAEPPALAPATGKVTKTSKTVDKVAVITVPVSSERSRSRRTTSSSSSTTASEKEVATVVVTKKEKKDKDKVAKEEPEPRTKPPRSRSSSTSKTKADDLLSTAEGDGEIFECPWPGCKRVFDRVKSRSAHLKWHGGSYKESSGSAAQPGTPSEGAPMVVAEEADAPVTSAKRSSTGSGRSKPPAKKRAIAPPLETGQSVVLSASGEARFHSYRGKSGLVEGPGKLTDGEVCYKVLFTTKSRGRPISIPRSCLMPEADVETFDVPQHLAMGQIVLGLSETFDNGGAVYMRGQITDVVQNGTDSSSYVFQTQAEFSKPVTLLAGEILVDSPANISDLKVADRVAATMSGKHQISFQTGSIQRLEPSRARINYDGYPVAWRKASDIRLLPTS